LSVGSFDDAKKLFRAAGVFTSEETEKAIKGHRGIPGHSFA
jgi:hypothetical protein